MKKSTLVSLVGAALLCANSASADINKLWLAGDAMAYGWSLDDAVCILASEAAPEVYNGTVYLQGGKDFKFLTTFDFGNEEWGAAPDATLTDGRIDLAMGKDDTGYGKIQVAEDANYAITVDLTNKVATIVKAECQDPQLASPSYFMVGDATPNGWEVTLGTPLFQDQATPYVYTVTKQAMKAGSFKITRALKGGFDDPGRWLYAAADDATKVSADSEGDHQWQIAEDGNYDITMNVKDMTMTIAKSVNTGLSTIEVSDEEAPVYYNLQGQRVDTPAAGLYIRVAGENISKVIIR